MLHARVTCNLVNLYQYILRHSLLKNKLIFLFQEPCLKAFCSKKKNLRSTLKQLCQSVNQTPWFEYQSASCWHAFLTAEAI